MSTLVINKENWFSRTRTISAAAVSSQNLSLGLLTISNTNRWLYSQRRWLEACNFGYMDLRD